MIISVSMVHKYIRRDLRHRSNFTYSSRASYYVNGRMHHILMDLGRDLDNTLGDNLVGLVVGGAYGRGDGRFLPTPGKYGTGVWSVGQAPIDDIELFLITNDRKGISKRSISLVLKKYAQILGVGISLQQAIAQRDIGKLPRSPKWYELARFHVVVFGPITVLDPLKLSFDKVTNASGLPVFEPQEARRLLHLVGNLGYKAMHYPSSKKSSRHSLLCGLADVLCVQNGVWHDASSERLLAAQSLCSVDPWFLDHPARAETLLDALRTMESGVLEEESVSGLHDYPGLWLIVHAYVQDSNKKTCFPFPGLARGLLSFLMHHSSGSSLKSGLFFRACFFFLNRFRPFFFS